MIGREMDEKMRFKVNARDCGTGSCTAHIPIHVAPTAPLNFNL